MLTALGSQPEAVFPQDGEESLEDLLGGLITRMGTNLLTEHLAGGAAYHHNISGMELRHSKQLPEGCRTRSAV